MSGLLEACLVALGAAIGAPLRFVVSGWLDDGLDDGVPWGTLAVNVVGSSALGLLSGAAVDGRLAALLGVGLCGGLTTYSSFAVQTHRLGRGRGPGLATAYAVGTLGLALAACAAGFALGA